jgi:hypothetical protein
MWSILLAEPIMLESGEVLRTLEDARLFLVSIPSDIARHEKWQTLSALLVDAAMSGEAEMVQVVTDRLKQAIETPPFAPVRLMSQPRPPKVRRRGVGRPRKKLVQ